LLLIPVIRLGTDIPGSVGDVDFQVMSKKSVVLNTKELQPVYVFHKNVMIMSSMYKKKQMLVSFLGEQKQKVLSKSEEQKQKVTLV